MGVTALKLAKAVASSANHSPPPASEGNAPRPPSLLYGAPGARLCWCSAEALSAAAGPEGGGAYPPTPLPPPKRLLLCAPPSLLSALSLSRPSLSFLLLPRPTPTAAGDANRDAGKEAPPPLDDDAPGDELEASVAPPPPPPPRWSPAAAAGGWGLCPFLILSSARRMGKGSGRGNPSAFPSPPLQAPARARAFLRELALMAAVSSLFRSGLLPRLPSPPRPEPTAAPTSLPVTVVRGRLASLDGLSHPKNDSRPLHSPSASSCFSLNCGLLSPWPPMLATDPCTEEPLPDASDRAGGVIDTFFSIGTEAAAAAAANTPTSVPPLPPTAAAVAVVAVTTCKEVTLPRRLFR
mmetsp:Transcript_17206/g.34048  ORF Transcript_17206/g.34048 Transcript_17206/m.34048 type:complete len:351 (-) Transcript_17206:63-1115(-)